MRQLWTITRSDLRQRVRDRSVIIFGLIVPLALMFVLDLLLGGVEDTELNATTVAMSAEPGDEIAAVLTEVMQGVEEFEVTVEEASPQQVQDLAEAGDAELGIVVPDGFGDAVAAGEGPALEIVEGEGAGLETDVLISITEGVLDQVGRDAITVAAGSAAGLTPEELAQLAGGPAETAISVGVGEASAEQLSTSGMLVAGQAGLFLLFTVGFGVLGLLAERDQGTMPRLRSMPMRSGTIVAAKGLVGFILGVVATSVLLTIGSVLFDASFGSPLVVLALVLCVVTAATSLMFIVARIAKTAEQASIAQSILAIVLGMAGGAFFPIQASGLAGTILDLNPIAAFIRALGISAGGGGLADLGTPVAVMLGFAVVCWLVSRVVPDRGVAA